MKKTLAITIAFMYLVITSGLVLQIHYCMGRQTGTTVQFAALTHHTCSTCGMQNAKNKCCHDELTFLRLQDVHQQVSANYVIETPAPGTTQTNFINVPRQPLYGVDADCNPSPPGDVDDGQPSLFIFHHLFRI